MVRLRVFHQWGISIASVLGKVILGMGNLQVMTNESDSRIPLVTAEDYWSIYLFAP